MFITSMLRKVLHVQLDLAEKVCFTSAFYRNGASAYGNFITVIYVQTAGLDFLTIGPPPASPSGKSFPCVPIIPHFIYNFYI